MIILYLGNYETLMLEGMSFNALARDQQTLSQSTTLQSKTPPAVRKALREQRDHLLKNPKSIAELISITPVRHDGKLVGYRLNPKKSSIISSSRIQTNDLAKSLNGYDLTDMTQAIQAIREARTMQQISVTCRAGRPAC